MLSGQLTDECHGKAILDSGCTTTAAGEKWLTDYLKLLPKPLFNQVIRKPVSSSAIFEEVRKLKLPLPCIFR